LVATAALGVLCLLTLALGSLLGVRPLLFRSGSMSPTISTGDIAFARTVSAEGVHPGDIVSLVAPSGQRVTHRVVGNTGVGEQRKLTLKGDANNVIDPLAYDATSVQKVFLRVPKLGYAIDWLSRAPGVYLLAAYVALMLTMVFRRRGDSGVSRGAGSQSSATPVSREPVISGEVRVVSTDFRREGRRRLHRFGVVAGVVAVALLITPATWAAAWTNPVVVAGQQLTSGAWGITFVAPVNNGSYGTKNANSTWTTVCSGSPQLCANVVDADGTSVVKYTLTGTSGTQANKCYDGNNFVASPSATCAVSMSLATGTATNGQWRSTNITRQNMGVGTYTLTVTATDANSRTMSQSISFTTTNT